MAGVRTVKVGGVVLTRKALGEMLGTDAELSPVEFDVARNLPAPEASQLYAWLRRRGLEPEISGARSIPARTFGRAGKGRRIDSDYEGDGR